MGTFVQNSAQEDEHIFRSRSPDVRVPDNITLLNFCSKMRNYTLEMLHSWRLWFAKALWSLGLKKGQVEVVVLPNVAEYAIVALGIMAAGGVFSGANPSGHASEIKKQVEVADAKIIVTNGATYEKVKAFGVPVILLGEEVIEGAMNWENLLEAADRAGNIIDEELQQTDPCALPFSSGTTGLSKGVMLTHLNLVANLSSTLFGVTPNMIGKVTVLCLIPFFHIYGITGICCATLQNKGKVVVMGRFELRTFLNALIPHEVTYAPIVPPIILNLVKNPIVDEFDLSKLKLQAIMTAAAPLAPEVLNAFENKFPRVQVQEAYGLTEHSCITLTEHAGPGLVAKKNSVGFILPNLVVKFIDPNTSQSLPRNTPGELCVLSQCVMQVSVRFQTDYRHNGWLHTGDIGYIDDDDNVFIVERIKELIKYKGFQVAPAELEAILLCHASVEDVAVVPLPDEEAGEIPAACVVITAGAKESEEEIINYVASKVAQYKKVRVAHFVVTIPKSLSAKVMRRLVKESMIEKSKASKLHCLN
ncbi:4-coumarate--CoA ligase-like 1 [Pyrus ussuriensis x Pyrus communis]|uniref:4-coumarate--CoA ligase-like 1 n=1 Tax=Pyrus ussuriensis x Pyrus communis TaxID=2448454 RepID=A0A5N5HNT9_9ROSA|nr:4-coumarate--CoA ligase-like 1 [Pyrus ussuriensis x Pyrus communis]